MMSEILSICAYFTLTQKKGSCDVCKFQGQHNSSQIIWKLSNNRFAKNLVNEASTVFAFRMSSPIEFSNSV